LTTTEPILQLKNVWAGYGDTVILEELDLSLAPGEAVSVIGRNGVGKTTLMETIMGHTHQRRGQIFFGGRDISLLAPYERAAIGIGYVPQQREIFPSLSVIENLTMAARSGAWTLDRVFSTFPRLAERRQSGGVQLSGGEQQMLAIARALMLNPRLLVMDEPSEGLAPTIIEDLVRTFALLRAEGGMAILLVEQKTAIAFNFAKRCVVMNRGRVAFDGEGVQLRNDADRLHQLVGVTG
jgi:branched-chain amino acid transport system ATP-binding protein